jgi:hypothetical protein
MWKWEGHLQQEEWFVPLSKTSVERKRKTLIFTYLHQVAFETFIDNPFTCVNVKGGEDIVQQKNLSGRVDRPCQSDPCLAKKTIVRPKIAIGFRLSPFGHHWNPIIIRRSKQQIITYLRVSPFSPTSVWSPAWKRERSRSSPHWWITKRGCERKNNKKDPIVTLRVACLVKWRAKSNIVLEILPLEWTR